MLRFDGDGDVLIRDAHERRLSWRENLDGRGTFTAPRLIADIRFDLPFVVDLEGIRDKAGIFEAFAAGL